MNYILKSLIHQKLEKYFSNIDKNTNLSILSGKLELRNLIFSKIAINDLIEQILGFGSLDQGIIGKLEIEVPWTQINHQSIEVNIQDIQLILSIDKFRLSKTKPAQNQNPPEITQNTNILQQLQIEKFIKKVIFNLKINIQNIDIIIRLKDNLQIQFSIQNINSFQINDLLNYQFIWDDQIISRLLEIQNLKISINQQSEQQQLLLLELFQIIINKQLDKTQIQIKSLKSIKLQYCNLLVNLLCQIMFELPKAQNQPTKQINQNQLKKDSIQTLLININLNFIDVILDMQLNNQDEIHQIEKAKYKLFDHLNYQYIFSMKSFTSSILLQQRSQCLKLNFETFEIKQIQPLINTLVLIKSSLRYQNQIDQNNNLQDLVEILMQDEQNDQQEEQSKNIQVNLNKIYVKSLFKDIYDLILNLNQIYQYIMLQKDHYHFRFSFENESFEGFENQSQSLENLIENLDTIQNNNIQQQSNERFYQFKINLNSMNFNIQDLIYISLDISIDLKDLDLQNLNFSSQINIHSLSVTHLNYLPIFNLYQESIFLNKIQQKLQIFCNLQIVKLNISKFLLQNLKNLISFEQKDQNLANYYKMKIDSNFQEKINDLNCSKITFIRKRSQSKLEVNFKYDIDISIRNLLLRIGDLKKNQQDYFFKELFVSEINNFSLVSEQQELRFNTEFCVYLTDQLYLQQNLLISENEIQVIKGETIVISLKRELFLNLQQRQIKQIYHFLKFDDNYSHSNQISIINYSNYNLYIQDCYLQQIKKLCCKNHQNIILQNKETKKQFKIGVINSEDKLVFSNFIEEDFQSSSILSQIKIFKNYQMIRLIIFKDDIKFKNQIFIFSSFYLINLTQTIKIDKIYNKVSFNDDDNFNLSNKIISINQRKSLDVQKQNLKIDQLINFIKFQDKSNFLDLFNELDLNLFDIQEVCSSEENFERMHFFINYEKLHLKKTNKSNYRLFKQIKDSIAQNSYYNLKKINDLPIAFVITSQIYLINKSNQDINFHIYNIKDKNNWEFYQLKKNDYSDFNPFFDQNQENSIIYVIMETSMDEIIYRSEKFYLNQKSKVLKENSIKLINNHNDQIQLQLIQQCLNETTLLTIQSPILIQNKTDFDLDLQIQGQIFQIRQNTINNQIFANLEFGDYICIKEKTLFQFVEIQMDQLILNKNHLGALSLNFVKQNNKYLQIQFIIENNQKIISIDYLINLHNHLNLGLYIDINQQIIALNQKQPLILPCKNQIQFNNTYFTINLGNQKNFKKSQLFQQLLDNYDIGFFEYQNGQFRKEYKILNDQFYNLKDLFTNDFMIISLEKETFVLNFDIKFDQDQEVLILELFKNQIDESKNFKIIQDINSVHKLFQEYLHKIQDNLIIQTFDNIKLYNKIEQFQNQQSLIQLKDLTIKININTNNIILTQKFQINADIDNQSAKVQMEFYSVKNLSR